MSLILAVGFATNNCTLLKNKLLKIPFHLFKLNSGLSSSCNKKDPTIKTNSSTPHPPKDPPDNYNPLCVEHKALEVPDFIPPPVFRPFTSPYEVLGPGADKRGCYKNSEYFSYHRYSFVALQLTCLKLREERMKVSKIRCLYDYEDSDDDDGTSSSDEDFK